MTVDSTEKDLTNAMRVLVICGDNWIVYNGTGVKQLTNITEDVNGKFILKTDGCIHLQMD